ncbi:type IV pilus modification protein PilV [Cellvibrio sp.]|uniref:type IV pilus modification protein PilV n=1 Tax=Cellvibrio sp. TaxID=1965322 RepID=UPI0039647F36
MKNIRCQQGATLIEIAITVLILSTSLLAMATLQARSLQFNKSAVLRSQANIFAYDIIDRIRINRGDASANISAYTADYAVTPSGNSVATSDVSEWRANLTNALPNGKGKIRCELSTRVCSVTIQWSEEQIFGSSSADATSELVYSSSI